jgi:XTP/dITP diphosphohydrolase
VILHCATTNPGKLREFQLAASDFDVQPLALSIPAPEENGATFEENACVKALHYGRHTQGYLFADDSGLEVDALGGQPGVYSARFAGPDATDLENNALLIDRLRGVDNRAARFVCVIALVRNGDLIATFRGAVEGRIVDAPRGPNGFGYDPLFYYEPFGCTFGEIGVEQKMRVSHRAQALGAMFTYLRSIASI